MGRTEACPPKIVFAGGFEGSGEYPDHRHDNAWELLYVREGIVVERTRDNSFEMKPGTLEATLAALEPRIDTSGEGLFGWVTVRGVGGVAAAQAGDSPLGKLPADFASKADAVAFGGGTVDGRAQFRVIVHAPQARLLSYIAPRSFAPTLKTAGEPRWAMTVALPTAEAYKTFEDNLNLDCRVVWARDYRMGVAFA